MIKIAIVGTGTVSKHLMRAFSNTQEVEVLQVIPSRGKALSRAFNASLSHDHSEHKGEQPDVYIIAVSDDAIKIVSQQLAKSKKLVAHTSGSVAMNSLPESTRRGVFYPLQTFSKGREVDFKTIPICIEAEKKEDLELLRRLSMTISESVFEISSKQRKSLHLAAVFVNNFTNHIYQIGNEICHQNEVSFDILKPLITETVEKLDSLSPIDAQSGPAKRHDDETIEKHLNQLKNKTHKEIYQVLTKSIQETT